MHRHVFWVPLAVTSNTNGLCCRCNIRHRAFEASLLRPITNGVGAFHSIGAYMLWLVHLTVCVWVVLGLINNREPTPPPRAPGLTASSQVRLHRKRGSPPPVHQLACARATSSLRRRYGPWSRGMDWASDGMSMEMQ